jgi:hypothetical protein
MRLILSVVPVAAMAITSPGFSNIGPKLSPEALLERADVAGVVRVTGVLASQPRGPDTLSDCWNAAPVKMLKSVGSPFMVICLCGISEIDPPALRVGQAYAVRLRRSPSGILVPITKDSWTIVAPAGASMTQ